MLNVLFVCLCSELSSCVIVCVSTDENSVQWNSSVRLLELQMMLRWVIEVEQRKLACTNMRLSSCIACATQPGPGVSPPSPPPPFKP